MSNMTVTRAAIATEKPDHPNPLLRHIPKFTQKLNPFKNAKNSNSNTAFLNYVNVNPNSTDDAKYPLEAIYNSNIPVYKKNIRSTTLPPTSTAAHYADRNDGITENAHRQRIPTSPPINIYNNSNMYGRIVKPGDYPTGVDLKNGYGTESSNLNGSANNRDEQGKY